MPYEAINTPSSRNIPLLCLLVSLFCQCVMADPMDVGKWETFRATTLPQFRMAFPGPVKEHASDIGHTYSGDVQPFDDMGFQVGFQAG